MESIRKRLRKMVSTMVLSWSSITGKPNFHTVATSGDYNDLENKPTQPKRTETFSGTTNASGIVSFSFTAFTSPRAIAEIINPSINQDCRVTTLTTTSCTVHAWQRNSVTLLGVDVPLSAVVNLSGATIHVKITEA